MEIFSKPIVPSFAIWSYILPYYSFPDKWDPLLYLLCKKSNDLAQSSKAAFAFLKTLMWKDRENILKFLKLNQMFKMFREYEEKNSLDFGVEYIGELRIKDLMKFSFPDLSSLNIPVIKESIFKSLQNSQIKFPKIIGLKLTGCDFYVNLKPSPSLTKFFLSKTVSSVKFSKIYCYNKFMAKLCEIKVSLRKIWFEGCKFDMTIPDPTHPTAIKSQEVLFTSCYCGEDFLIYLTNAQILSLKSRYFGLKNTKSECKQSHG
ncbi:unnamed protein product [Moneuplotes crassus]|uniref:Uncharacterized protein n=1 Tax=Euplotes crassus TaxID=5936 RepID=A0AAD2D2X5_EUPCR|nr:unnamed protein product [Moneuplotes crassus]